MKKILLILLLIPNLCWAVSSGWYSTLQGNNSDVQSGNIPDGSILKYSASAGQWKLSSSGSGTGPYVDITSTAGGSADPTGTNDTSAAWTTCITAAGPGGTCFVPPGLYKYASNSATTVTGKTSYTGQGVTLWFSPGAQLKVASGYNPPSVLLLQNGGQIWFPFINASGDSSFSGYGILFDASTNITNGTRVFGYRFIGYEGASTMGGTCVGLVANTTNYNIAQAFVDMPECTNANYGVFNQATTGYTNNYSNSGTFIVSIINVVTPIEDDGPNQSTYNQVGSNTYYGQVEYAPSSFTGEPIYEHGDANTFYIQPVDAGNAVGGYGWTIASGAVYTSIYGAGITNSIINDAGTYTGVFSSSYTKSQTFAATLNSDYGSQFTASGPDGAGTLSPFEIQLGGGGLTLEQSAGNTVLNNGNGTGDINEQIGGSTVESIASTGVTVTGTATVNGTSTLQNALYGVETFASATSITPTGLYRYSYMANTKSAGTFTVNAPTNTNNTQVWCLKISSTAVQTFSWNSVFDGGTVGLPTGTLGTSTIQYFYFTYDSVNSKWDYNGSVGGF